MVSFTFPGGGFFSPPRPPPPPPPPTPFVDKRQKQVEDEGVLLAEKRKRLVERQDPKLAASLIGGVGSEDKLGA